MASGQPIDLISLLEPARDFLDDRLKLQDGQLITPPFKSAPGAIGMIPYDPVPAEYDIELQLQRLSHRGPGFNMGLLVGGRQVAVGMDSGSFSEKVWGLDFLDGNPGQHRLNPTRNPGSRLLLGKTCKVTIQVRNNHITASCDGETLIDWTGAPERLSLWDRVKLPRSDALFFWAQADFVVHKMTLIPRGVAASPMASPVPHQWPADAPPPAIAPFNAEQAKAHQEAWAKYLGVPVEKEIVLGRDQRGLDIKLSMILVPPGEFVMGSSDEEIKSLREQATTAGLEHQYLDWIVLEGPQRLVRITRPFYMSKNEFSTEQFRAFVQARSPEYKTEVEASGQGAFTGGRDGKRDPAFTWKKAAQRFPQGPDSPVVNVTWNDANQCCEWLSQQDAGWAFALPTEAQWEYACRAGTTTLWSTGNEESSLENYAVINANWPKNVGERLPNAFGLCDMHGNVWEWCQDAFYNYRDTENVDPVGPVEGERRIIRGGSCLGGFRITKSWIENSGCRSAVRYYRLPYLPLLHVGFRVSAAIPEDVITAAVSRNADNSRLPADAPPAAIAPFDADQAKAHQDAWAKHLEIEVVTENSLGMEMVLLPPGEFRMGAAPDEVGLRLIELPQHQVRLTRPFRLGRHEVTVGQFREFIQATGFTTQVERDKLDVLYYRDEPDKGFRRTHAGGSWKNTPFPLDDRQPVTAVSLTDASAFCDWLSKTEGREYRLPTEAEWEYACRAGSTTPFPAGRMLEPTEVAFNRKGDPFGPAPVGSFRANPFGLHDLFGNVFEWCIDGKRTYTAELAIDPIGPVATADATQRGGAWSSDQTGSQRVARRDSRTEPYFGNGFRVAQVGDLKTATSPPTSTAVKQESPPPAIAPFDADEAKQHQAAWAKHLGVPVEKEIVLGRDQRGLDIKLTMTLVPPGEFVMGSSEAEIKTFREQAIARGVHQRYLDWIELEGPQRRVRITRPYYLSKNEFKTEQFKAFVDATGYRTEPETDGRGSWPPVGDRSPDFHWQRVKGQGPQGPDSPVVNITWNDANRCCEWLSRQDAGLRFGLPTEAQWEYACRAGTTTLWSTGNEESSLENYAVINARWTRDVGDRLPNAFGLHDMHGNVWEYCQDAEYNYRDAGAVDPIGATDGQRRIIRGGGCFGAIESKDGWMEKSGCRSAVRYHRLPDNPLLQVGFRVAAAIPDDVIQAAIGSASAAVASPPGSGSTSSR